MKAYEMAYTRMGGYETTVLWTWNTKHLNKLKEKYKVFNPQFKEISFKSFLNHLINFLNGDMQKYENNGYGYSRFTGKKL